MKKNSYPQLLPRGIYVDATHGLCFVDHAFVSPEVGVANVYHAINLNNWLRSECNKHTHPPTNAEGDE